MTVPLAAALLDTLLPTGADGRAVLLACDDQALAAACAHAGADDGPVDALRAALRAAAPVTSGLGISGLLEALPAAGPAGVPADLALLCACVLAASRMSPDERHSTHAYYTRLGEVLDVTPRTQHPAIAGFEQIPGRFAALAAWMADAEGGRRGRLVLPADPWPRLVGVPISQAPLRAVDRDRLDVVFAVHRHALDIGRDPLRVLASHPVRHALTGPAQRLLDDLALHDTMRAALLAAYRAWDGTARDAAGRPVHATRLRLGISPGRVTLNLSLRAAHSEALTVRGPGDSSTVIPAGKEGGLDLDLLAHAAEGPVDLRGGGLRLRALPGPVMLFEAAADGFWLTAAADSDPVFLLTCRPDLAGGDWGPRRAHVTLPDGWALICDVDPAELPEELRLAARPETAAGPVWLTGGLTLERRDVWLADWPPQLAADTAEPLPVRWTAPDGSERDIGEVSAEQPLALAALEGQIGTHRLLAADRELVVELADRGLRAGAGTLAHRPAAPELARAGAISDSDAALFANPTPVICGAQVDGRGLAGWQAPLVARAQAIAHIIYRDGSVRPAGPGGQPQWARHAGLPPAGMWEIPDGDQAVWMCVIHRRYRRIVALAAVDVPVSDAVLDLAEAFADAPVIDRADGHAEARWRQFAELARVDEEEPVDA